MQENVFSTLSLMAVGMTTVFLILILVVLTGHVLILVVNSWGVDDKSNSGNQELNTSITKQQLAAIQSTVEIVTGGKGRIEDIKRLDQ